MKIVVSEIPETGIDIDTSELLDIEEAGGAINAKILLRVDKTDGDVMMRGDISATLKFTCGRCLKDFSRDMVAPVDLVYSPAKAGGAEGVKDDLAIDDIGTSYYKEDEINVSDIVMEQIRLGIPMKPLCSENCKGLCPKCGADLNETTCKCVVQTTDPRLMALEKYLKDRKE